MNNKLLNIFSFVAAFFVLIGCSDEFLQEKKLYNQFNDESVFTSQIQTDRYLAYIYYTMYTGRTSPVQTLYGAWSDDKTKMTEEMGGTINNLINSTMTLGAATDASTYYGTHLTASPANTPYTRIRDCNTILENVEKYGRGSLPDAYITTTKGQAYFLRALQYFDLMRTYGGVPLVTTVQSPTSLDNSIKLPRASVPEMVKQIVTDLDSAKNMLPADWTTTASSDFGRPTKGAAMAMKCRVLMTAASPLFNSDWDNSNNQLWKDALQAGLDAKAELDQDGYTGINPNGVDSISGKYASAWAKSFYNYNNTKNPEAIFTILTDATNSSSISNLLNQWQNSIRLTSQKGGGGIPAPQEMIDLFPMKDGGRPSAANGYNQLTFFKNRDPRFYRTFGFSGYRMPTKGTTSTTAGGTVWNYAYLSTKTTGTKIDTTYNYSDGNKIQSPAFVLKTLYPQIDSTAYNYSGVDIIEYRYGELLLNIAECYAATNNVSDCLAYLGKVRARVGIPAANNYGIGTLTDKYAAIEACLYERRIELAYEGKRFWDVQRWMLYNDDESAGNNTCAKLRINPINGTCRTGNFLMTNVVVTASTVTDPLLSLRAGLTFDPDVASDANLSVSRTQLNKLTDFYTNNLRIVAPKGSMAMDKLNNTPTFIGWRQNYYIQGLSSDVLNFNPWLEQTAGWTDYYGNPGIFTYR
jgi:SusD family.